MSAEDNGFNPIWQKGFVFDVDCPDLALIRFAVYNVDMFGDADFLGQATYPLLSLRTGFRSVPLKNEYSEPLELASLLIQVHFRNAKVRSFLVT
jgi:phosphatidylinositol phospholipase C gamma-1